MAHVVSEQRQWPIADAERQAAQRNLASLSSEFAVSQEWGLFLAEKGQPLHPTAEKILSTLKQAEAALATENLIGVEQALLEGRAVLNQAQLTGSRWYLANTQYGLGPIFFTVLSGAITYWVVFVCFLKLPPADVIHHAGFLGLMGALLKSLYWLQLQISNGSLRPRWWASFLVTPLVGVLLGAISSLLVKVGFKLAGGGGQALPDWRAVGLIAAFAGFNWEWALEKFRAGADTAFSAFQKKRPAPGKGM